MGEAGVLRPARWAERRVSAAAMAEVEEAERGGGEGKQEEEKSRRCAPTHAWAAELKLSCPHRQVHGMGMGMALSKENLTTAWRAASWPRRLQCRHTVCTHRASPAEKGQYRCEGAPI